MMLLAAAVVLVGQGEETHQRAVFLVQQRQNKRDVDCKAALLSIYIVDSNFIPPREITGKLILGSDQTTHGEQCKCMTELCHKRGMQTIPADLQPYQNVPMDWFPYCLGPAGLNHAIFLSRPLELRILLCC